MEDEGITLQRNIVRVIRGNDDHDDGYVAGNPGDLFTMVWEITRDLWAFGGKGDVEHRLQRDVTTLIRRTG
jgi:hypothetical protein